MHSDESEAREVFQKLARQFMIQWAKDSEYNVSKVLQEWQFLFPIPESLLPDKNRRAKTTEGRFFQVATKEQAEEWFITSGKRELPRPVLDSLVLSLKDHLYHNPTHKTRLQAYEILLHIDMPQSDEALIHSGTLNNKALIISLKNENDILKKRAYKLLVKIGSAGVDNLIQEMNTESEIRGIVMSILDDIGDPKAIPPLIELLIDWEWGPRALESLQGYNWEPTIPKEYVYYAVASRDQVMIRDHWEVAKNILLKQIEKENRNYIESGVYSLIASGKEEVLENLLNIISEKGTKTMAKVYLNCGKSELEQAARLWAKRNGYQILTGGAYRGAVWGSFNN